MGQVVPRIVMIAFLALISACSGGGSSSGADEIEPPPSNISSGSKSSWSEDTKLIEIEIEYFNYLPERLNESEIIVYIDSDDSNDSSLSDVTIKLEKTKTRPEGFSFYRIELEDVVLYPESFIAQDARGYGYEVEYSEGATTIILTLHSIMLGNTRTELSDQSFSVRVSTSVYDSYEENKSLLSRDFFPTEFGYQHVVSGAKSDDVERDYEGNFDFSDIKSVKVTNYID